MDLARAGLAGRMEADVWLERAVALASECMRLGMRLCAFVLVCREETGPVRRPGPRSGPAFFLPGPVGPAKAASWDSPVRSARSATKCTIFGPVRSAVVFLLLYTMVIKTKKLSKMPCCRAHTCVAKTRERCSISPFSLLEHWPEFRSGRSAAENSPVRSVRSVVGAPVIGQGRAGVVGLFGRAGRPARSPP